MAKTVLITGNTYPVKEKLKAMGGKWDPNAKGWRVPEHKAAEAQRLVGGGKASKPAPKATRRSTSPRKPKFDTTNPPVPGAQLLSGRREGRHDSRYEVGVVFYAPKAGGFGGGPGGHYYVPITSAMFPPCEDNQQFTWMEMAWVRPATDEEAAPLHARRTAKEEQKVSRQKLEQAIMQAHRDAGRDDPRLMEPASGTVEFKLPEVLGLTVIVTDQEIVLHKRGYDGGAIWHAPRTDELLALAAKAQEGSS